MDKANLIFSQDFNFKEAEEAPDDQFLMKDVYFNIIGPTKQSLSAKKKPNKKNNANFFRDQIDKASKIKEKEIMEQQELMQQSSLNGQQQNSFNGQQQNNSNGQQQNILNGQQQQMNNNQQQQNNQNQLLKNDKKNNNNINNNNASDLDMEDQEIGNMLVQNKHALNLSQIQTYSNEQSKLMNNAQIQQNQSYLYDMEQAALNKLKISRNVLASNDSSSSSDQEYHEPALRLKGSVDKGDLRVDQQSRQRDNTKFGNIVAAQPTLTQSGSAITKIGQKQSQFQVGATCVQNKKNKKRRNPAKNVNTPSNSISQVLAKKVKPFYSANRSSQSSQNDLDDDVEEDEQYNHHHHSTFTQKFQPTSYQPFPTQNNISFQQQQQQNLLLHHQQQQNMNHHHQHQQQQQQKQQQNILLLHQQQQQQRQRSQDQNDASDLSPCIAPMFNNFNQNDYLLQQQHNEHYIKIEHLKQLKSNSSTFSNESEIEESNNYIKNRLQNKQQINVKSSQPFIQQSNSPQPDREQYNNATLKQSQITIKPMNNQINSSKISQSTTPSFSKYQQNINDPYQSHLNAAVNIGNIHHSIKKESISKDSYINNNNLVQNYSDKMINTSSPSRIVNNNLARNSLGEDINSTAKKGDYYLREKCVKQIDEDQSIITVRIESVCIKPFQTVIAEIISIEKLNPHHHCLKPSQIIHAILKQSYSMQGTLKVGTDYIFKFQTLEYGTNLPIVNVNQYILK